LTTGKLRNTYKGAGYIIVLTTLEGRETRDELYLSTGTIEVKKGDQDRVLKIHGECGC
jgi:hypothetical protein